MKIVIYIYKNTYKIIYILAVILKETIKTINIL